MTKLKKHWSNFWESGQLTTLPEDFDENYNGTIHLQWMHCFKQLPTHSRLLDVCSGNCAISLLAAEHANKTNKTFELTALDAAHINKNAIIQKYPHQAKNILTTKLVPNCKIEDYNTKNKYDFITSQYGIEYCDWKAVSKKIYSLLEDNGRLAIICHSAETDIIKNMKNEQQEYLKLIKIGQFLFINNYIDETISYQQLIKQISSIQKHYRNTYVQAPSPLVQSFYTINQNIINSSEDLLNSLKNQLQLTVKQYSYAFLRLKDLINVSNNIKKNPNWFHCFTKAGLILEEKKTLIDSNNIGIFYQFRK
jgi:tRNA1(Val) A37 N6-methylase TrmN6